MTNSTPVSNEESLAQGSVGAPQNPLIQPGSGSSKERNPWDKFLARLRSVRLVKSAKKLRGLRDDAKAWYPAIEGERQAAQAELETATDPLDQAALKEELETIAAKVTKLDDGLSAINKRAKALVGEPEA